MDLARAAVLIHYEQVALSCGLDPARMLREAGIDPRLLGDPDRLIPFSPAAALLARSADLSGCEEFGLLLAEKRPYSALGPISLLLIHLPTLHEAIEAVVRYQRVRARWLFLSTEPMDGTDFIHVEIITEGPIVIRQMLDWLMLIVSHAFTEVTGGGWRPESAHFALDAPGDRRLHERLFPCPVVFSSSFTGFVCAPDMLRRPNPRAEPTMALYARRYLESLQAPIVSDSTSESVRRALHLLLPAGRGTLEQVGELLRRHPRSIQRQLWREGQHYASLLDDVRSELAMRYLQQTALPMGSVAHLVGYATPSAFARWFHRKFRCSPQAWRSGPLTPSGYTGIGRGSGG